MFADKSRIAVTSSKFQSLCKLGKLYRAYGKRRALYSVYQNAVILDILFGKCIFQRFTFVGLRVSQKRIKIEFLRVHAVAHARHYVELRTKLSEPCKLRISEQVAVLGSNDRSCRRAVLFIRHYLRGKVFLQFFLKKLFLDGFGQIIAEPCLKVHLLRAENRVCGERYDLGILGEKLSFVHFVKRFDTVKLRHHVVEENNAVMILRRKLYSRLPRYGCIGNNTVYLQQIYGDFQVHLVIIDN